VEGQKTHRTLKVDLHTHTADDPIDHIPYSTIELIDRAAELRLDAVAITLHDRQLELGKFARYANERGVTLLSGVERTIQGRHVLLINFPPAAASIDGFDDLAELEMRHPEGLVIAPHPFFPHPSCLGRLLDRHAALFHAVEFNAFYTSALDFNREAIRWARAHGRPVIGNSDAHRLPLLGRTYSLVEAEPNAGAICAAVKEGRTQVRTQPIGMLEAAAYFASLTLAGLRASRASDSFPAPAARSAGLLLDED
jgi:predicted metal-dependent phosphoesterase TrpH